MKLAITRTPLFPHATKIEAISGGYRLTFIPPGLDSGAPLAPGSALGQPIDVTRDAILAAVGPREVSDCANLYYEVSVLGALVQLSNKMIASFFTKNSGYEYCRKNSTIVAAQVVVPFANSPFEDWVLRVNTNQETGAIPGLDPAIEAAATVVPVDGFTPFMESIWPTLKIVGTDKIPDLAPGASGSRVTAQLMVGGAPAARAGVSIFAKAASGYIARETVETDASGKVSFNTYRLGLATSDDMTVKLGFKYRSNVANAKV